MILFHLLVLWQSLAVAGAIAPPTLGISQGEIQGGTCQTTAVDYYLSIPYAKPPVGDLRFASPEPFDAKFNGTLDASKTAPGCIQFGFDFTAFTGKQSEDCLYLDVWKPANATRHSKLPVKVWLYGGFNVGGTISDPLTSGCFTASNTIVVAINYRLGPLGWFALERARLTGNYGLQDQLLGLKWVQKNIVHFGGDPKKVLLFGQSAGAQNVFAISTLEQAPNVVNAVIMESGGGVDFANISQAEPWNRRYAQNLNCSLACRPRDIRSCLRAAGVSQIVTASADMPVDKTVTIGTPYNNLGRGNAWGPLVDGKVIPSPPSKAGSRIPSVFGSNTDEGTVYVLAQYGLNVANLTATDYDDFLEINFGPLAATVNVTYPITAFAASPAPAFSAMSLVTTHARIRCAAERGMRTAAAKHGVAVYTYSFSQTPTCSWETLIPNNPAVLKSLGATHSAEIPFVFGYVDGLPPPNGTCDFTAAEKGLSAYMVDAWRSMAAEGRPGSAWPLYTVNASLGVNLGNLPVLGVVDYSMCKFWDPIQEALWSGSY